MNDEPITLRQRAARAAAKVFLLPVAAVTMLVSPTKHKWLDDYSEWFNKLAGPKGFRW